MDDFTSEDAVETDNSAIIALMQDVKNKAVDSLSDLVGQNLPQEASESAPTCPLTLITARADMYALEYVFGQIASFLDDLEHSLPGVKGSFSEIVEHAFGAGFQNGHLRNYTIQEWIETRRDGPQKSLEEVGDIKILHDMISSEFRELKSRLTNLEGHVPREQMPAPVQDRSLYASIHAPTHTTTPTQGRPSYAATAAAEPTASRHPPVYTATGRPTQPPPSKKQRRGITANTQIAARSKNGHTLSFSVDPLPAEQSAIDTFAMTPSSHSCWQGVQASRARPTLEQRITGLLPADNPDGGGDVPSLLRRFSDLGPKRTNSKPRDGHPIHSGRAATAVCGCELGV
ncbi:hypothetical protein ACEPAI_535 [Sanghuangporus weigelae]